MPPDGRTDAVYRHLLVAIDATDLSTVTVGRAAEFAKALGARITFFHAQINHAASLSGDAEVVRLTAPEQFAYSFEGRPLELLSKAESAARARGVACSSVCTVSDSPSDAILAAARTEGCDLIYMASHGRRTHLGMLLGSQTLKLLLNSEIPVLVSATRNPTMAARTIGIICDEHRSLAAVLHGCLQLLKRTAVGSSGPAPELLHAIGHYIKAFPVALHHPKEEDYLFRKLRERTSEVDLELEELGRQHQRDERLVDELTDAIERCCDGKMPWVELEQAVDRYAKFIFEHMAREERVILPAAERHLNADDWEEIDAAFSQNQDPRFDEDIDGEYRRLFSRIVNLARTKTSAAEPRRGEQGGQGNPIL